MTEPINIFEELAQEYDAWFCKHRFVYESEILAFKRFMSATGGLGLEIGVGTGRFAVPLGIEIGVEPAKEMAGIAARRGIKVFRALAEALPFRSSSFDLVTMITVISFFQTLSKRWRKRPGFLNPAGKSLSA